MASSSEYLEKKSCSLCSWEFSLERKWGASSFLWGSKFDGITGSSVGCKSCTFIKNGQNLFTLGSSVAPRSNVTSLIEDPRKHLQIEGQWGQRWSSLFLRFPKPLMRSGSKHFTARKNHRAHCNDIHQRFKMTISNSIKRYNLNWQSEGRNYHWCALFSTSS